MGSHLSEGCGREPGRRRPRRPRGWRVSAVERTLRRGSPQEVTVPDPGADAGPEGGKVASETRQRKGKLRLLEVTARRVRNGEGVLSRPRAIGDAGREGEPERGERAALRAPARAGGCHVPRASPSHRHPRNLSFIAALTERAYYRSQRPSLEDEPEEETGEGGTRLGARSRAHAPSRGRRARSAPAGGGGFRAPRSRSPDTRKRVRFADALGLELAAVRRFRPGEIPRVPRHVQVQLQRDALRHFAPCQPRPRGLQEARAALEPANEPGFAVRLQAQRICLERAEAGPLGVAGSARVLDLAYEKRVSVRWSADGWRSQREAPAAYAGPAPPPPRADRFAFRLPAPPIGGALLFALRYRVTGLEFWDNNGGRDYALRGPEHPGSGGAPEPQGWIHFI